MLESIRDEFNDMDESISESIGKLDDLITRYEEEYSNCIKDIDNFIFEMKKQDLYDEKMEQFIEEYMKWSNK